MQNFRSITMKTRLAAICGLLLTAGTVSAQNQGVGWWRLDEQAGQIIVDSSGSGNNGYLGSTPVGDPEDPTWLIPGRLGSSALSFFPQTVAIVPVSSALEPLTVSVAAWVQAPASPGNFAYIVGKGASGCLSGSYALYTGPQGGAAFYIYNGISYVLSPAVPPSSVWDGNWHHLVGTFDGSAVHLFLDGVEVGSGTPTAGLQIGYNLPTSNDVSIGGYNPAACPLPFYGKIDEVRIWNQALTPAVISTLATKACNFVNIGVKPATVAAGGFVTVSGQLQNCLPSSQPVVIQVTTSTPCTKTMNYSLPLTLPANFSQSLSLPIFIPKGTCTGSSSISATTTINGFPVVMSSATLNVTP